MVFPPTALRLKGLIPTGGARAAPNQSRPFRFAPRTRPALRVAAQVCHISCYTAHLHSGSSCVLANTRLTLFCSFQSVPGYASSYHWLTPHLATLHSQYGAKVCNASALRSMRFAHFALHLQVHPLPMFLMLAALSQGCISGFATQTHAYLHAIAKPFIEIAFRSSCFQAHPACSARSFIPSSAFQSFRLNRRAICSVVIFAKNYMFEIIVA